MPSGFTHTESCSCGFADLERGITTHFDKSKKNSIETASNAFEMAALLVYHAVCALLSCRTRNRMGSLHITERFKGALSKMVSTWNQHKSSTVFLA